MDVLFVTSWYPSTVSVKNGNFIEQHALALKSTGCNVVVVHVWYSNRTLIPGIKSVIQNDIPVHFISMPKVLKNSVKSHEKIFKKLISMLNNDGFKPEIIHGHVVFPAGRLALYLKNHYSVPLVYTEHWSGYKPENTHLFTEEVTTLTTEVLGNTDLILPVSHDLAKTMAGKGFTGNYAVVNNTVNTSVFYLTQRDRSEKFRFLHVSNFEPRSKNTEGIIRAFVNGKFENATLTIAGDGDLDKLRAFAKSLDGDISQIVFIGRQEYAEVADLMRKSDCFILFSNFENLPCVIAESHCCGLPVLATKVGGIPEMIDASNGVLIPAGDEEKLIAQMRELIAHRISFNQSEIAEKASMRYSYETIGMELRKHYDSLLQK